MWQPIADTYTLAMFLDPKALKKLKLTLLLTQPKPGYVVMLHI